MMRPAILALAMLASPAIADPYGEPLAWVQGTICKIHDADTFRICSDGNETKIRLRGVDAPEVSRRDGVTDEEIEQGKAARDWFIANFDGAPASCAILGINQGRMVADCWIGSSLGKLVVGSGLTRACPAYGGGYVTRPEAKSLPAKGYCE